MVENGVVEFQGNGVPQAHPQEISEELTDEERGQLAALKGDDPVAQSADPETAAPEVPQITDAKPEEQQAVSEAPAKPKKEPRVPLAEVQKERERRQALEKELADYRDKFARGDERLRLIQEQVAAAQQQQQVTQQQPAPDPEPNKEADLFAWQEWKNRQLEAAIAQRDEQLRYLYQQTQQTQQEREQAQYRNQYQSYIQSNEQAFATQNPQYFPAIDRLRQHVDTLFSPAYPDPGQRAQVIAQWTDQTIRQAAAQNRNPAEVFYGMAKQIGFSEADAQQVAAETQTVANVAGRPNMATVQRAQHATRSLSNTAGAPTVPPASVNDLANMTEEQWEAYRERIGGDKALARVYGQR